MTVIIALLAVGSAMASPDQEFEKKILKEFPITANGEVEISNKYGEISIETWSDNKVKIEVTIKVDARNQSKADDVFSRVNVAFSNTSSFVRAETEIESSKYWKQLWDGGSTKFEVNYQVFVPSSVEVDLDNKYGDILLGTIEGDAEITLKYGNLSADEIGGDLELDLGYGKGSVNGCKSMRLEMKYYALTCGDIGDLNATTKYSSLKADNADVIQSTTGYDNYKIGNATSLSNVGKYDDFEFQSIESVVMNTKYSNLDVGTLTDAADLEFKNGSIKLRNVKSGFSSIDIDSDYAGITIGVESGAQFTLEAQARNGSVKTSDMEIYHDVKKSSETEMKGYRGSRDASSWIKATMNYGSLKIQ